MYGDIPLSEAVIAFMERLIVPSGKGRGEPLKLREWQKKLIRDALDPQNPDGTRRIRRAIWSFARKNGKTALAAALLLAALVGPLAIPNGEVYSAATTREQAAVVYKMASQMVKADPELNELCKCLDNSKRIVCYHLNSFYQALAAEAGSTHGQNPHFAIYDELAQAKTRELYDVINTSFDAQPNALFLVISTQSSDAGSVMSDLVDDALLQSKGLLDDPTFTGAIYVVPDDADPLDESVWHLANPALGDFKMLAGMQAQAAKAARSPAAMAAFRNLHLNQRVDSEVAFLAADDWRQCEAPPGEIPAGRTVHLGIDLSGKRDLTAIVGVFPRADGQTADMRSWFFTPSEDLAERSKLDGAQYPVWRDQGWLNAIPGRTVDLGFVARKIIELNQRYNIAGIRYDRWRIDDLKAELENHGFDIEKTPMNPNGQGFKDMAPAIDSFEEVIVNKHLFHDGNPALTYCLANVKLTIDPAGNRKFDKRARNKRIDGAVAGAMAVQDWKRPVDVEIPGPSVYETRGVLTF
jgi:phage terminase large subunit-like protein